jgi:DNA replication and repair protein RecF
MSEKFKLNLKREILQGITLFGPHRDDFDFLIDGNDIKEYGSQGQHRLAVLCLKFGEIEIFKNKVGEYPILLLDDIFSELDKKRKNNIIKYIRKDIQTFITTTDINKINKNLLEDANIYNIKNGEIK